jgi:hypothetical protein
MKPQSKPVLLLSESNTLSRNSFKDICNIRLMTIRTHIERLSSSREILQEVAILLFQFYLMKTKHLRHPWVKQNNSILISLAMQEIRYQLAFH